MAVRYGLAVGLATAAACLAVPLAAASSGRLYILVLFLSVFVSAIVGGFGPGMVATLLCAFASAYFIFPPAHSLHIAARADLVAWAHLVSWATVTVALAEWLQLRWRGAGQR